MPWERKEYRVCVDVKWMACKTTIDWVSSVWIVEEMEAYWWLGSCNQN